MIERFRGDHNKRKLIEAIKGQLIVCGEEELAIRLCDAMELSEVEAGNAIITQDSDEDDLFLILAGSVTVQVHGREVAAPKAGEHVGEMVVIDPKARRSASVIALEQTVLGRIAEPIFSKLADDFPNLWRRLAVQLGERLRQRNNLIVQRNPRPVIFLGSSKESLPIVRAIQSALQYDDFIVRPWSRPGIFGASRYPMEDLEQQVRTADFAVLVLGPDDVVVSRESISDAPRDNVIFELGLFMGALTRERTFIILPRDQDIKVPTDLLGLNPLSYTLGPIDTLPDRIEPACNELREIVNQKGTK
jgi:CRP/FNR family cyclic AMP-dependent transcriptional regulator